MSNNVSPTNRLKVLQIDASMRRSGSVTRELADDLVAVLEARDGGIALVNRDFAEGLPFTDESWIGANVTDPAERSDSQKERLALSETLVDELKAADVVVIASPIYNFNVPAAMKVWIDLIARARETSRYTENGPVGLLEGKKAYVVSALGGTEAGDLADAAIIDRLVPICVGQYEMDTDKASKLAALKKVDSWNRGEFVAKQGWATMPGSKEADTTVARSCGDKIVA